ncbi:MAG: hypothetical protein K2R98_00705 [Gemmataceae bacterium]|nr:hypothetical protein [Gemmataceae bacterium]
MSVAPRWRAPAGDADVLIDPPLTDAAPLLKANRDRFASATFQFGGRSLDALRRLARADAFTAARDYLRAAGEPVPSGNDTSLILAGHQPELFHPGVWVKNFALNGVARAHGATPINLVVDNDTAKSSALRLPHHEAEDACGNGVQLATVPFDHWGGEVPYEELRVRDEALFASFTDRAAPVLAAWGMESMLPAFWGEVRRQSERTPLLGERFAAARRHLERRWGCHNLELPISVLCRTEAFAWFALLLLSEANEFHRVYNTTVREHRHRLGIRSKNHPVPDLAEEDDWLEMPFWAGRVGEARRGRLFVRTTTAGRLELRSNREPMPPLPLAPGDLRATVAAWQNLEANGFKVRSRALTTTLFARVFLSDLFLHGIGGGNYDILTDDLIRSHFHLDPPAFMVISATRHLPLPSYPARPEQRVKLARNIRDLRYNPQRHMADHAARDPKIAALVARQRDLIAARPQRPAERRQRFETLRGYLNDLRPSVAEQERQMLQQLACTDRQLQANAILQRRDYAFCLFSEGVLKPFCAQFL